MPIYNTLTAPPSMPYLNPALYAPWTIPLSVFPQVFTFDPLTGYPLPVNYTSNYPFMQPYTMIPPTNYPFSINKGV